MKKCKTLLVGVAILTISLLILTACGSASAASRIRPTWIKPQFNGDMVSISAAEVKKNVMNHFKVSSTYGELSYMAYIFDGQLNVRADICPPCRSESFSLVGNTLVCDACGTVFDAKTGAGVNGPCINYPKEAVKFNVSGDTLEMKSDDLITAYRETLKPGR